jgi:hypothetical protein
MVQRSGCTRVASLTEIAARAGVTGRNVIRLLCLALAPAIVEAILEGHQLAELTAQTLVKRSALPLDPAPQKSAVHR